MTAAIYVVLIVVIGGAIAGEIALRLLASRLRPLTTWNNWEVHNKLGAAKALADRGGASVVAIGHSAVNAAVDPYLLTRLLGRDRPAFNAALNGTGPRLLELWTLELIVPLLRPDVVVFGIDTTQLNEGNILARQNLDRLLGSEGWHDLTGTGTVLERFVERASKRSLLVRYRRFLGRRSLFRQDRLQRSTSCRRLGLLRWVLVFRYRPYSVATRQSEAWRKLLNDYRIGDDQLASIRRLVDGLRARGVVPMIVPVPFAHDWISYHPGGEADVEAWRRATTDLLRHAGLPPGDLSSTFSMDHFADPLHVNGKGQVRFTELVAGAVAEAVAHPAG